MTLFLLPLLLVVIYLAMYLMRTDKTPGCRWRAYRRDDDGVHWSCLVCGGKDRTGKQEPAFCARRRGSDSVG
jgi:hypothetical protein